MPRIEKTAPEQKTKNKTEVRSKSKLMERKSESSESIVPNKPKEMQEQLNGREQQSFEQKSQTSEKEASPPVELKQKPTVKEDEKLQDDKTVSLQGQSQGVEENSLQALLQLKQEDLAERKGEVSEQILHAVDALKNEKSVLNLPKESFLPMYEQDISTEMAKPGFESTKIEKTDLEKNLEHLLQQKEEKVGQLSDNVKQSSAVSEEVLAQLDKTTFTQEQKVKFFEPFSSESEMTEETNATPLIAVRSELSKEEKEIPEESVEKTRLEQGTVQVVKMTIREELDVLKNQYLGQEASEEEKGDLQKKEDLSETKEEIRFTINQLKTSTLNVMVDRNKSVGAQRTNFDLASRVMEEVKISLGQNKTQMQIKLYPETLGKLTIKLSSENGVMNASFFAENDKAKLIIESQMAELRKILESQGIQVQNLSVTVDSGREELTRHKNLMEAQKYSKIKGLGSETDTISEELVFKNPYMIEDEFTERI